MYECVCLCVCVELRVSAYIRRLCFERLTGQTGCPGLDLRGKRTEKGQHYPDLHHKDKDAWIGDLEIMIHKERRMNGKLLGRVSTSQMKICSTCIPT